MIHRFQNFSRSVLAVSLLFCLMNRPVAAQPVILHLKSGDQISGLIVSENTKQVVLSNAWVKAISIPLAEISKRETVKIKISRPSPPVVARKPKPAPAPPVKVAAVKLPPKPKGKWNGEVRLGLDAIVSGTDQQDYSGHLGLSYARPYDGSPKKFFRNTSNFDAEYQKTDGQESANHASASNKSDFDIGKRSYGYVLFGAGYDDIQRIDFQYQVGPGAGVHLIQNDNFVLNFESGLDYQEQDWNDASTLKTFSARVAQDLTWKIEKNLKLTENMAFYSDLEHTGQFHDNFTSTLSYGFWKNLTINLTALNDYDTEVAPGVDRNRFEIRSSLGVTF